MYTLCYLHNTHVTLYIAMGYLQKANNWTYPNLQTMTVLDYFLAPANKAPSSKTQLYYVLRSST